MAVEIRVPPLGESLVEATVGRWLKQVGEQVTAGEVLVELETDKVSLEVNAEQAGVLEGITRAEGETVAVGEVLGTLSGGASSEVPVASSELRVPSSEAPVPEATNGQPETRNPQPETRTAATNAQPETRNPQPETRNAATPVAQRLATEHQVDLANVQGSGPGGRVMKGDVLRQVEQGTGDRGQGTEDRGQGTVAVAQPPAPKPPIPNPQSPTPTPRREERVPMTRRRRTIAQRLVEAQHTAAMLTTFNELDMSAVMALRQRRRESFKERHGVGLGFMSFFTKAVVGALKAFPLLNAEIQGDEIVIKHYYDIGIAVGAEEGLVVPVLRDAGGKSFAQIEREIAGLAQRARENKLALADLQGGTFTITNGGVFGSLMSTPILNAPQVGILGMHKIEERPIALKGEVVIRPMMYVALSYDHRIVDGSEAVRFLVRMKELVEDPEALLLEG